MKPRTDTFPSSTAAVLGIAPMAKATGLPPAMLLARIDAHDPDRVRVTITAARRRSQHGDITVTMIDAGATVTASQANFLRTFGALLQQSVNEAQQGPKGTVQ